MAVTLSERDLMKSKRVKVSEKRQITIPKKFYEKLNLSDEVECFLRADKNEIVIRPVPKQTEFAEEILRELIENDVPKDQLLAEFRRKRDSIRSAVERIIEEADQAALNLKNSGDDEMEEIFGDLED